MIICRPNSVSTKSETSFSFNEKTASSKGFTISPREKNPKSPPFFADSISCDSSFALLSNIFEFCFISLRVVWAKSLILAFSSKSIPG